MELHENPSPAAEKEKLGFELAETQAETASVECWVNKAQDGVVEAQLAHQKAEATFQSYMEVENFYGDRIRSPDIDRVLKKVRTSIEHKLEETAVALQSAEADGSAAQAAMDLAKAREEVARQALEKYEESQKSDTKTVYKAVSRTVLWRITLTSEPWPWDASWRDRGGFYRRPPVGLH